MPKLFLVLAAVNGFLSVALGAFAAHALNGRLPAQLMSTFQTGVQYHMYHSLALLGIGILSVQYPASPLLRSSGLLLLAGILIFSGSLYILSLSGVRWLGAITPIGGLALLAGWATLAWFAWSESFAA